MTVQWRCNATRRHCTGKQLSGAIWSSCFNKEWDVAFVCLYGCRSGGGEMRSVLTTKCEWHPCRYLPFEPAPVHVQVLEVAKILKSGTKRRGGFEGFFLRKCTPLLAVALRVPAKMTQNKLKSDFLTVFVTFESLPGHSPGPRKSLLSHFFVSLNFPGLWGL